MSIDCLQEKIRKVKNPSMFQISPNSDLIPPSFLNAEKTLVSSCARYGCELLRCLSEIVPAVRFSFSSFALLGEDGIKTLKELALFAQQLDYYVVIDGPEILTKEGAESAASTFFSAQNEWHCDALLISSYIGSDGIRPFIPYMKKNEKDLFVVARTGNPSASEIQDLLTGSRLVHMAVSDIVSRLGEPGIQKCGYSSLGAVYCAGAPESLKIVRQQHRETFLLIDGYDYSNANAKNCSYGFDRVGHGAIVCAEKTITGAWRKNRDNCTDPIASAVEAAERMRKNILQYVTVL